jgi:predicted transposase YdaD
VYNYAIDTAFEEGKFEGKLETAKSLKKLGVSIETIIEATRQTREEIELL